MVNGQKAIFLDKDGTLIENIPYNVDPEKIRLCAGAAEGVRSLHRNYQIFLITNQSGIAFGYFPEAALSAVEKRCRELLSAQNVLLADFFYCPHHPKGIIPQYTGDCFCRKPKPGLFKQAAFKYKINLQQSWAIGDILDDIEAGKAAGCRTILIDNGNETEWRLSDQRRPHYIVPHLLAAAKLIEKNDRPTTTNRKISSTQGAGNR